MGRSLRPRRVAGGCGPAPANRSRSHLVSTTTQPGLLPPGHTARSSPIMSSDSEFYPEHEYENISRNIIAEVKKRPALYDHTTNEYNNKHDRKRLWEDVYRSIFKDWNNFTERQQKIEGDMIQKKWKNIKDSFLKELAFQKGKTRKKKRKYIHYDSLLFLLPSMQRRAGKVSNRGAAATNSGSTAQPANEDSPPPDRGCSRDSIEHTLDKEEDIDEEKHFAMMLVAMLRRLDDDQKHYAKVEILNVLHKAKSYTVPWAGVEDVRMMGPHSQLSLVYGGNACDVLSPAAVVCANATDVGKKRRKSRVKEEVEMEEPIEEN